MVSLKIGAPPVSVVLASLLLWVSFAWGLPAEAPAAEGEAAVAAEDRWAGVRISDAYDYAECPQCWKRNDVRAESCTDCGNVLPQPSAEMTDPDMVFVPGKGYYREGTLLEPAKTRKGFIITGYALIAAGAALVIGGAAFTYYVEQGLYKGFWAYYGGIAGACVAAAGGAFLVLGYATRKDPVYALNRWGVCETGPSYTYARRSPDSDNVGLKVEVTVLGF
jgi:hypothetical protein